MCKCEFFGLICIGCTVLFTWHRPTTLMSSVFSGRRLAMTSLQCMYEPKCLLLIQPHGTMEALKTMEPAVW